MKNTQLIEILASLNKSEFKEFGKYIISPFFNNRSEVIRFFNAIKKFYPLFDSEELSEEVIFILVYPGKDFSDVLMRKLISLTTNLVLDFIAVKGFKENTLSYNVMLMDKLRERKLPVLFEKRSKITGELLENIKRDIIYYEHKLKHTSILNGHFLNSDERSMISKFQIELDDLVEFFLSFAMIQYIRISEWSKSIKMSYDMKFYDEVVNYFKSKDENEVTLSTLYFNIMMMVNTEEVKYFNNIMKFRKIFEPHLSDIDDYNIIIMSMQYCYKKVLKGNFEYRKQMFDTSKIIFDKNLIPAGFLEPYLFTNIIRNASYIKEFDWAEKFIKDYKNRLNPDKMNELTDYSFAMIEMGKGNFEKSLAHLSKINIEMSNMKMEIKNLLIMIYYELNYIEELISMIDSYKHFLKRDKTISDQTRIQNSLFIRLVSDLVKVKLKGDRESVDLYKKELDKTDYFILKDWLLRKTEELVKNYK